MYHFVKFNDTQYLKPEKLEDVIDHFKKFCGREFNEGFEDFRNNSVIRTSYDGSKYRDSKNHSSSVWRYAVEMTMDCKGMSWLESASSLEERTYKDRIKKFLEGKPIFFTDGLPYYPPIEWPGGRHWYVKIGNIDIGDSWGHYKFSDKSYAQKVAKKWCKCGGDWSIYKD